MNSNLSSIHRQKNQRGPYLTDLNAPNLDTVFLSNSFDQLGKRNLNPLITTPQNNMVHWQQTALQNICLYIPSNQYIRLSNNRSKYNFKYGNVIVGIWVP